MINDLPKYKKRKRISITMRIVDLFSGAGGLTFGFYYRIHNGVFVRNENNSFAFANEYDKYASETFIRNYPTINMINCDIKDLSEERIRELVGDEPVDVMIGGPPCQSFSTIGQRLFDDKAKLYQEYFRVLDIVRPKMFLFENVKGLLSMKEVFYKTDKKGNIIYKYIKNENKSSLKPRKRPVVDHYGKKIIDIITNEFKDLGYTTNYKVLNAVNYGVPEYRERVFIVGTRNDTNLEWEFPKSTTTAELSIKEAISDLPCVGEGKNKVKYIKEPSNLYQKLMRNECKKITQHYCGTYGDKIRTVIKNMKQGQGKDDFNALVDAGIVDEKYRLTSGYANTYGRLVENQPSPTITNNLSTPSGLRCIHYSQDRALTPREGARIQSFPDWFEFCGSKTDVTTQIGNAVPPLLSICLALQFEKVLKRGENNE